MALTSEQREAWTEIAQLIAGDPSLKFDEMLGEFPKMLDELEEAERERHRSIVDAERAIARAERAEAALAGVRSTADALLRAIAGGRFRYERVHVEADLRYLAALADPEPRDEGGES